LPKFDPNQEEHFGVAGADLNITAYDRPQFAFANLLRGDIDGVTRAMLSPSTMTPSQIKTVKDVFLPGKKHNPVMQTILDISTNPLVIMGLVLGMKFPLGTTAPLLTLRKGLIPKGKAMNQMFSGLHDAMMNLRTIPGMWEKLNGVVQETQKFVTRHGDKANNIFLKAGKMTKAEGVLVSARLDGLHKSNHYMVKALQNEPEWQAFFGAKDVAIAPNIQNKMRKETIGLSDRLRGWFDNIRKETTKSPEARRRIEDALEKQGLEIGGDVDNYLPRRGQFNRYRQQAMRGATGTQYRKYLHEEVGKNVAKSEIKRSGGLFANLDELRLMEESGAIRPGFVDKVVEPILKRQSNQAALDMQKIWSNVSKMKLDDTQERLAFIAQAKKHFAGKKGTALSHLGGKRSIDETLDAMAGSLQDARFRGPEKIAKELAQIGDVLGRPGQYSLNPWEATSGYLSSVANSHAWHGTGLGEGIMKITRQPGIFREAPYLESYLMDNIIPHVRGMKSYTQMQRSLNFTVQKEKMYNWVKKSPFVESALGKKTKNWLTDYLGRGPKSLSAETLSAQISHSFYLSTLGANLAPASKNLMQNILTTMNVPGIGPQGIWRGLKGAAGQEGALVKIQRYVKDMASGTASKDAFRKAFPEYVKDMGDGANIVEAMLAGDVGKEGMSKLLGAGGAWEKTKKALLFPFSTSEAFNRIVGYYSGRNSHLFHNAAKLKGASAEVRNALLAEAGEVGQTLTMASHFSGGPLGIPKAIMNLPSFARQYMHFPLRNLGFLQGSLRMGADANKMDWGTIGRALTGSTATYLAAKNLAGVDLSSGLLTGSLPVPTYENAPFHPFPLVPPAFSVAGAGIKALVSGDSKGLGATASMLVPGGVGVRRAYKSLSPRYADYKNRTQDGRVPIYNQDKALIGTLTPAELTLRAMGIKTSNIASEQGAAQWLMKNRDRIREYRRNYLEALSGNDMRAADQVQAEFKKVYPELGPLQVKKSDIRAVENRRQVSRVHRVARGLPSAYKPIFEQIIGEATMNEMVQNVDAPDLGLIPSMIR
jgi:hypothetical protein